MQADIDFIEMNTQLQQLLTAEQAWHFGIIPKYMNEHGLEFYVDEERSQVQLLNELEVLFDKPVKLHPVPGERIKKTLGKYYRRTDELKTSKRIKEVSSFQSEDFLLSLINEAYRVKSSDIHFEPFERKARIRFRIDGKLIERYLIERDDYPALVNKIKVKSNLDIAEKRLPQDGRIIFSVLDDRFDIRVSIMPVLHGEKVVLRLLANHTSGVSIEDLGFEKEQLRHYLEGTKKSTGIILISGPTGSGNTTTLYATLRVLYKPNTNILTIEDPIEYTLEGINQVQLKEQIGLTFASALRSFLRQDPDVIMLGEIRDQETAQMAIRAALTGHLVLSTVHTNSAWGIIDRLIDMDIPAFLVASTINLAVSQRLIRILCENCREEIDLDPRLLPQNGVKWESLKTHHIPRGCESCFYTGYKGRKALYEVIPFDDSLADSVKRGKLQVYSYLKEKGYKSLSTAAFQVFKEGKTSLEEVYSILLDYSY